MALIRDRYEPLAIVGCGGQGEVLKARDTLHDRTVALKLRRLALPDDQQILLSEAKTLRDLTAHAGVTQVREDFFENGRYYLVMEWVDGAPLDQIIDEIGPLSLADASAYLRQIAEALDHLHAHEPPVIHGDVKPANIVVRADGRAALVDFGIAARADAVLASGTTGFRAPELRWGAERTPAADVYGLAATAYTLLTGRAPAPGVTPDWNALAGDDAARLEQALRRGLAYDPDRRPRSASAFIDALAPPPVPNNLPAALTRFIGREREIEQVREALQGTRLLTLAGVGGAGKTRLALQVASEVIAAFPGGVWVVDLAQVRQAGFVPQAIARAMSLREQASQPLLETVAAAIGSGTVLIVLDNCEHLLDACARAITQLLSACSRLTVLATSRERLDMLGESVFDVPTLTVPDEDGLADIEGSEAGRLFLDRARTASPAWRADDDTAPAIASIARRLDGIPLAIELAAARMRTEQPSAILAALDRRFDVLVAGNRGALPRQQTLRATMDWSYGLLDAETRFVLQRLGVFAGGFNDEAARAVCGRDVTGGLDMLVHHSLIARERGSDRYRILETVRDYAAARLDETEESDAARDAHGTWIKRFAAEVGPGLTGSNQVPSLEAVDADYANARAALDRFEERRDTGSAYEVLADLGQFFWVRGHWTEARERVRRIRAIPGQEPTTARANAIFVAGWLAAAAGDYEEAHELYDDALATARACGDARAELRVLAGFAHLEYARGDSEAAEKHQLEALAVARAQDDLRGIALALNALGGNASIQSRVEEAAAWLEEGLAVARALGEPGALAAALDNLGDVRRQQRRYDEAIALTEEGIELMRDSRGEGSSIGFLKLGNLALMISCDPERSLTLHETSLELARKVGAWPVVAIELANAAQAAAAAGRFPLASTYFEEALTLFREHKLGEIELVLVRAASVALRLDDRSRATDLLNAVLAESVGETAYGLAQEIADVAILTSRFDIAARALGYVASGGEPEPFEARLQQEMATAARAALGVEFDAAFEEGGTMSAAEVLALIADLI